MVHIFAQYEKKLHSQQTQRLNPTNFNSGHGIFLHFQEHGNQMSFDFKLLRPCVCCYVWFSEPVATVYSQRLALLGAFLFNVATLVP